METNIITVTNYVTLVTTNAQAGVGGIDVVKQVNDYYSASFGYAFNHICLLLGWLLTLLGIAVPAAYYFLQNRQLEIKEKQLEERLTNSLKVEINKVENELKGVISKSLNDEKVVTKEKFDELEKKINSKLAYAIGGIFQVQGNFEAGRESFEVAAFSYCSAIIEFSKLTNLRSVQTMMRLASESLSKVKAGSLNEERLTSKIKAAIETVEKLDSKGLLDDDVKKLKQLAAAAFPK